MRSILNACLLLATVFFVGQQCCYYHRLLCHSLVRSVILLGMVRQVYNYVNGCALSLPGCASLLRCRLTMIEENKTIAWHNINAP